MKKIVKTVKLKDRQKLVYRAVAVSYSGSETEHYFHRAEWVHIRKLVSENERVIISSEVMDSETHRLKFGDKPYI